MSSADGSSSLAAFQSALESGDWASASAALDRYVADVRSGRFGLTEIAQARDLIEFGLRAAVERRAVLSRDLAHLRQFRSGYRLAATANTWEISG